MHYVPHTNEDRAAMLATVGAKSIEDLLKGVPPELRRFELKIPAGISELELDRELDEIGHANKNFKYHVCYLGAGNYDHFVPAVVDRLSLRGEFITAYTPYQGEASQGTLQSLYEYQSLIAEITAMDYSNGSMYDGASALAEAALLALRHTGKKRVVIPSTVHPEYRQVVRTYLSHVDAEIVELPAKEGAVDPADARAALKGEAAALVVQQPNFFGILEDAKGLAAAAREAGALTIACVNPISLGVVSPPGEWGADIAVGEGQPLGNPVSYGGPHFGFFTAQEPLLRKMPGRIAGMTVDRHGRRAFVLTLQAREQHIRREKATSNICTNQALCALKGAIYLSLLGKQGLRKVGLLNLKNAHDAFGRLVKLNGVKPFSKRPFFNEFVLHIEKDPARLKASFRERGILGPLRLDRFYPALKDAWLVAVTEKRTPADLERLAEAIDKA